MNTFPPTPQPVLMVTAFALLLISTACGNVGGAVATSSANTTSMGAPSTGASQVGYEYRTAYPEYKCPTAPNVEQRAGMNYPEISITVCRHKSDARKLVLIDESTGSFVKGNFCFYALKTSSQPQSATTTTHTDLVYGSNGNLALSCGTFDGREIFVPDFPSSANGFLIFDARYKELMNQCVRDGLLANDVCAGHGATYGQNTQSF